MTEIAGHLSDGTMWWLAPDGLTIWIENNSLDNKRFEEKGYHIGKERVLFPSKDRIAGEKTYSRLKSREHFDAWALNPSAFFDVYSELEIQRLKKYKKYADAIAPHIEWMKAEIAKRPDGIIRILLKDIKERMGRQFLTVHDTSIYWGLKVVLFREGLFVTAGKTLKDDKLLTIRNVQPGDSLPESLKRA